MDIKTDCSVLGKDVEITDATVPVISPYWRLKRMNASTLLWKYDPEQNSYVPLSPLMGATLSLFNGELTVRHLSMAVQYAHNLDTLEEARNFLLHAIRSVNKESDAIVGMSEKLAPYVKKYDPLAFLKAPFEEPNQKRPAAPLSMNIMFSNACETNCMYCYAHRRQVPPQSQLSMERWIEIFHEAHSLGIEQVALSGGDTLFRKDALTLLAELIKLEMLFLVSTKCHVTPEMAGHLVDIGMNVPINQYTREIQISMDGPDENTADTLAGSPGYFQRAVDSIKNLVERGLNLRVKAVATPLNASRVYEWIELLTSLGVKSAYISSYNRSFFRHEDGLFLSQEDKALIGEQFKRAKSDFPGIELNMSDFVSELVPEEQTSFSMTDSAEIDAEPGHRTKAKTKKWKDRAHCSGGRSSLTITPDGKVVLCDQAPQEGVFVVGDVTSRSIMDVWNSEDLLNFAYPPRQKFVGTACYDCSDRTDCHGIKGYCFRDSFFNYGSVYAPPPACPFAPDDGMRLA